MTMLGATIKTIQSMQVLYKLHNFVKFWAQLYIIMLNSSKLFSSVYYAYPFQILSIYFVFMFVQPEPDKSTAISSEAESETY